MDRKIEKNKGISKAVPWSVNRGLKDGDKVIVAGFDRFGDVDHLMLKKN